MRSAEQVATMNCPVCAVPLAMSDRQGIEIDYCPQCRGVWLDRGELDKIIERSGESAPPPSRAQAAPPPQQPMPDPRYDPRYGGGHYGKKRKHWLQDIFD